MNQRCRGDLFVEWILGIGDTKTTPYVRGFLVERKDSIGVGGRHSQQPLLEPLRLRLIAPMANSLDPLSELAGRYRRKVKFGALLTGLGKECTNARVALASLRASLITSVSTKYTSAPTVGLLAGEIRVHAHVRHASEHVCQRFPSRTL